MWNFVARKQTQALTRTVTDAHGVDANSVGANSAQPHGLITLPNGYPGRQPSLTPKRAGAALETAVLLL